MKHKIKSTSNFIGYNQVIFASSQFEKFHLEKLKFRNQHNKICIDWQLALSKKERNKMKYLYVKCLKKSYRA